MIKFSKYFIVLFLITIFIIPVHGKNLVFIRHNIDLNFDGIHRIKIIDLDKDGDLDIVGGSEITPWTASKGLAWWRNEGNNVWTRFTIDASFIHVMSVDTADINNDSYTDIVASSWQLHQIVWLKNSGDPTQSWTRYTIKSGFTNAHDAKCGDMDNDGDIDVIGASATPGSIIMCENDGSLSNWSSTTISASFSGALSLFLVDLDYDTYYDIIGTASNANQVAWWKNNGGNPVTWPKNIIGLNFVGASGLDVVYMNNDSLLDVVSNAWKSNQVAYWICNNIQPNSWTKHTVTTQLDTAADVKCSDLDKDNDKDIVAVGKIPGELVIYENTNFTWTEIQLEDNFYGGTALEIADMDKDGDDDIIAGASYVGELYWWENTLISNINEENENRNIPKKIFIKNYPNPFNPVTKIKYLVPFYSDVKIKVYDIFGKEISVLINEKKEAGKYVIQFDGSNLASGIYYCKIQINKNVNTIKMVLSK